MDPAHVSISHDRTDWTAKREDAQPLCFEVTERLIGFAGWWGREKEGKNIPNFLSFRAPCVLQNNREIVDKNGETRYFSGVFLCTPTGQGQGKSMLITRFGRTKSLPLANMLPKWYLLQRAIKVFEKTWDSYHPKMRLCFNVRYNKKDKHALLNFKQGDKDPSGVLSSWSTVEDCCEWRGVKCDNITSRVTELSLSCFTNLPNYSGKEDKSHCLTGSIYLSLLLVELEFLSYLDLRNNDFFDFHFDSMDSHNCHNLPLCQCVNSSSLSHLDLSFNNNLVINSLRWLPHISSLAYLNLCVIDLHKETNWLQLVTMLPSLSVLHMCGCQLEDLSLSLQYANFTALKVLDLSINKFNSELPKCMVIQS
ncbi:hypothetical protein JHK82_048521 [Glycine max]|nr:hypothetical protein JHK82_048521 [Glycine max]